MGSGASQSQAAGTGDTSVSITSPRTSRVQWSEMGEYLILA